DKSSRILDTTLSSGEIRWANWIWAPSGRFFIVYYSDKVFIYNNNGDLMHTYTLPCRGSIAIAPDSQSFILGGDYAIYVMSPDGRIIESARKPGATVTSIAWHEDGNIFACGVRSD